MQQINHVISLEYYKNGGRSVAPSKGEYFYNKQPQAEYLILQWVIKLSFCLRVYEPYGVMWRTIGTFKLNPIQEKQVHILIFVYKLLQH